MDAWIRFMAPVTPQSAGGLMRAIDQKLAEGVQHLHIMLSCPGGSVFHGLSVHNFLRGLSINITTYNFGSVDSIGVVIFCSGSRRYCVPSSRFHIHGVKLNFSGQLAMDEKGLEEHIKLLKTDYTNIARVIAATSGRPEKEVVRDMNKQTSLLPEQAKEYGLVHEVRTQILPANAAMTVIYEDGSQAAFTPPPIQQDLTVQPITGVPQAFTGTPQAFTGSYIDAYTSTPMGFTGEVQGNSF